MTGRGAVLVLAACSPAAETAPATSHARDAGVDATSVTEPDVAFARKQAPLKQARPVDIMLRSSPNGAIAAVDGVQIGPTPVTWFGETRGVDVEFTFVKKGYATARYRFVPVQSGVVHAKLDAATDDAKQGEQGLEPPPSLRRPPEPVEPMAPDAPPEPGRPLPGPQP